MMRRKFLILLLVPALLGGCSSFQSFQENLFKEKGSLLLQFHRANKEPINGVEVVINEKRYKSDDKNWVFLKSLKTGPLNLAIKAPGYAPVYRKFLVETGPFRFVQIQLNKTSQREPNISSDVSYNTRWASALDYSNYSGAYEKKMEKVQLKNGEQISGVILRQDEGDLFIATEKGVRKLPTEQIESIDFALPLEN